MTPLYIFLYVLSMIIVGVGLYFMILNDGDLPKMQEGLMLEFIQMVGEENLRWITTAKYPTGLVRGQILISPEGLRRVREHIKKAHNHADSQ